MPSFVMKYLPLPLLSVTVAAVIILLWGWKILLLVWIGGTLLSLFDPYPKGRFRNRLFVGLMFGPGTAFIQLFRIFKWYKLKKLGSEIEDIDDDDIVVDERR